MKVNIFLAILICDSLLQIESYFVRNYEGRMLNGEIANPDDFPYLVQLHLTADLFCGGAIIAEYYILTAAHCITDEQCTEMAIYPSNYTGRRDVVGIAASRCFRHDLFNPAGFLNDIGLVRTVKNLVNDLHMEIIRLPGEGAIYPQGTQAVIVGWGETEQRILPNHIRRADMMVETWDLCNYEYQHSNSCIGGGVCPVPIIPSSSMCIAGFGARPGGACDGDLGGPVIINRRLAGVISGVIMNGGSCVIDSSTLVTTVPDYLDWISWTINSNERKIFLKHS